MVYHNATTLDTTFFALADPTRREILTRLATGDRTISELAARFEMSLPAVSKHIYMLQRAGLATIERHGRVRTARLTPEPMRPALEWIERYRKFWESELAQLAAYLENTSSTEPTSWPNNPPRNPAPSTTRPTAGSRPSSKSGASSARRANASSTRGRKRKS